MPEADRIEWSVELDGLAEPIKIRLGAGLPPSGAPPGVTALSLSGKKLSVRTLALLGVPAKDVREIYDSFDASPDAHFVGGGAVRDRVDLRGAIVPIKVSTDCGYAPVPFFASTDGWGLSLESSRIGALAFPGSPGGSA